MVSVVIQVQAVTLVYPVIVDSQALVDIVDSVVYLDTLVYPVIVVSVDSQDSQVLVDIQVSQDSQVLVDIQVSQDTVV